MFIAACVCVGGGVVGRHHTNEPSSTLLQLNFVRCGGVDLLLAILSDEKQLADVDPPLKR